MSKREEKYRYCKKFTRIYGVGCSNNKYQGIMRTLSNINNAKKEALIGLQKLLIKACLSI